MSVLPITGKLAPIPVTPNVQDQDVETVDVTVSKLRLAGALAKAGINVDVTRIITVGIVEEAIDGPPQLVVTILDRGLAALSSGVFGQKVDVTLDGIPFRLVEVDLQDVEILQLTFEHKLVALLREHKAPVKASRSTVTRAQFIELLLREVAHEFPITFVSPEVNVVQPIAAAASTGRTLTSKTLGSTLVKDVRGSGFGVTHLNIRYWDGSSVTLGPSQLKNAAIVLQVCRQLGAPAKATLAVVAACIVEPDKPFDNTPQKASNGGSAGILQWGGGGQPLPSWANDVAQAVTHSLQDPGATSKGGIISLARRHPDWTAGQIAQAEQGSAFPARYDAAVPGAQTVISAFTSAGGFAATGVSLDSGTTAAYEFTRGQPGQPEDSWSCIQRLAREVNWRCFIAGRRTVYFVTDDDLLKGAPVYRITPDTPGVVRFGFQAEVGGRTVRVHHHRQPKPSEAQLDARFDRWEAPAGSVIDADGWGVGDGAWIITGLQRDLFDRAGTISLRTPQQAFKEPAGSAGSSVNFPLVNAQGQLVSDGTTMGKLYAACQAMDRRNLPYVLGGGHVGSWAQAIRSSSYDCSSAVSVVLYQAGLMPGYNAPIVSGDFASWGQPGRGSQMTVWFTGGHVFIEFYGRPAKRFDTVPGGSGGNGPHLRYTAPGSPGDTWEASGFAARHPPGL